MTASVLGSSRISIALNNIIKSSSFIIFEVSFIHSSSATKSIDSNYKTKLKSNHTYFLFNQDQSETKSKQKTLQIQQQLQIPQAINNQILQKP